MIRYYGGWSIYHNPNAPVTGRFAAVRWGVSMCANTEEFLISMIILRNYEERGNHGLL